MIENGIEYLIAKFWEIANSKFMQALIIAIILFILLFASIKICEKLSLKGKGLDTVFFLINCIGWIISYILLGEIAFFGIVISAGMVFTLIFLQ